MISPRKDKSLHLPLGLDYPRTDQAGIKFFCIKVKHTLRKFLCMSQKNIYLLIFKFPEKLKNNQSIMRFYQDGIGRVQSSQVYLEEFRPSQVELEKFSSSQIELEEFWSSQFELEEFSLFRLNRKSFGLVRLNWESLGLVRLNRKSLDLARLNWKSLDLVRLNWKSLG